MTPAPTAYDLVIYPGYAYAQTHPDYLAAYARLCGMNPAPVESCRVLEVGCGDAANLLPMAVTLPQATFYGFDLASSSIQRGQSVARELGLANLTLRHLDITDAPPCLGEFDYVIAHGFYSWVPQPARDKLMEICRASLAPQGVALISYNTLPGGHIRRMLREIMLFHVDRAPDPKTKTTQARALLAFLSELNAGEDEYQVILKKEVERVLKYREAHLYHDDLAPIFDCFYLHEFLTHAAGYDMQFLADLNSTFVQVRGIGEESARALADLDADPILREQYLDFACCRRFRQTLLCHSGIPLLHQTVPKRLDGMFVSSAATAMSDPGDLSSDADIAFRGARNASLTTNHPVMKAAMMALISAWPERLSFQQLHSDVAARLSAPVNSIPAAVLSKGIFSAFSLRMLDLHSYRPALARQPGERPETTPLIRRQAAAGEVLTSLLHRSVKVEGTGQRLLCLLDGTRTRAALAAELQASVPEIDAALAELGRMALIRA